MCIHVYTTYIQCHLLCYMYAMPSLCRPLCVLCCSDLCVVLQCVAVYRVAIGCLIFSSGISAHLVRNMFCVEHSSSTCNLTHSHVHTDCDMAHSHVHTDCELTHSHVHADSTNVVDLTFRYTVRWFCDMNHSHVHADCDITRSHVHADSTNAVDLTFRYSARWSKTHLASREHVSQPAPQHLGVYEYIYIYKHACARTHIHTCTHTRKQRIHKHTHTHAYTHTHTNTHTHHFPLLSVLVCMSVYV